MKVIANRSTQIVGSQHNVRPHSGQGVDPCAPLIQWQVIGKEHRELQLLGPSDGPGRGSLNLEHAAMTSCFNVGSAVRYLSTGSCIQSALMPVNIRMLLSLWSPPWTAFSYWHLPPAATASLCHPEQLPAQARLSHQVSWYGPSLVCHLFAQ